MANTEINLRLLNFNVGTLKGQQATLLEKNDKQKPPNDVLICQETRLAQPENWLDRKLQLTGRDPRLVPVKGYKCFAASRESFVGNQNKSGGVCIFVRERNGVSCQRAKGMVRADRLFHLKLAALQRLRLASAKLNYARGEPLSAAAKRKAEKALDAAKLAFDGLTADVSDDSLSGDIREEAELVNGEVETAKVYEQDGEKLLKWGWSSLVAALVTVDNQTFLVFSVYRHNLSSTPPAEQNDQDRCLIVAATFLQRKNPAAVPIWAGDFNAPHLVDPFHVFLRDKTILNSETTHASGKGEPSCIDLFLCRPEHGSRFVESARTVDRLVETGHTFAVRLCLKAPLGGSEQPVKADVGVQTDP